MKQFNIVRPMFWILLIILCISPGCRSVSSSDKGEVSAAQSLYKKAQRLKEKSYYKEALLEFQQFRNRYIYSPMMSEADLAIADIYFVQDEWVKAVIGYKSFLDRYPQHAQIDRTVFQLALSYFHQLPSTPDRDLSLSTKVLLHFDRHLKQFPNSQFKKESLQYRSKVLYLQAQKQWLTAQFYLKRGKPHSALPYLNTLLKDYSGILKKEISEENNLPSKAKLIELIKNTKAKKNLFVNILISRKVIANES